MSPPRLVDYRTQLYACSRVSCRCSLARRIQRRLFREPSSRDTNARIHRPSRRRGGTCPFSSMSVGFNRVCRRLNGCRSGVRVHSSPWALCATNYEHCLIARGMLPSRERHFSVNPASTIPPLSSKREASRIPLRGLRWLLHRRIKVFCIFFVHPRVLPIVTFTSIGIIFKELCHPETLKTATN